MKISTTALFRSAFLELIVRRWKAYDQLKNLEEVIQQDRRWLAHDRKSRALTERYLALLQPDWEKQYCVHSSDLRTDLNLQPNREPPLTRPLPPRKGTAGKAPLHG
jgi:hypothetical protein